MAVSGASKSSFAIKYQKLFKISQAFITFPRRPFQGATRAEQINLHFFFFHHCKSAYLMNSQGRLDSVSKCGDGSIEPAPVVFIMGIVSALKAALLSFLFFCLSFNSLSMIQRSPCIGSLDFRFNSRSLNPEHRARRLSPAPDQLGELGQLVQYLCVCPLGFLSCKMGLYTSYQSAIIIKGNVPQI